LISLLIRSSGFVDQIFCQCARGNAGEREHLGLGAVHERADLGEPGGELIAHLVPGRGDGLGVGLGEDRAEHRGDHVGVRPRHQREQVAGEVHPTALMRRASGEDDAMETVRDLRDVIDVRLPDERMVLDAARLKARFPMAYADAFGAALAISEAATLWTGDPELLIDGSPWTWNDIRRRG
jgi:predicted nucleic acid-binding protein